MRGSCWLHATSAPCAWVVFWTQLKCTREEDATQCDSEEGSVGSYRGLKLCGCARVMKHAGIMGVPGSFYGAGPEYMRLELLQRAEDFEVLASKLEVLVGAAS